MCVIALIPGSVPVPEDWIKNGAANNPDGFGWAVASEQHGLVVGKDMDADKAIEAFLKEVERQGDHAVKLFHARIGTHGNMDVTNVHPFYVPDYTEQGNDQNTVMAHNGIMPALWHPDLKDDRSDTRVFIDRTATFYITQSGVPSRRGARTLGNMITTGNKLVFLSTRAGKPKVRIVNSQVGVWDKGSWFSNGSYKRKPYRRVTTYYNTGGKQCTVDGCKRWFYTEGETVCFDHRPVVICSEEACDEQVYTSGQSLCYKHRPGYVSPYGSGQGQWGDGWIWVSAYRDADGKWVSAHWEKTAPEEPEPEPEDEEVKSLLADIEATLDWTIDLDSVDRKRTCGACEKVGLIHIATNICLKCFWCLDCWDHMSRCRCYDYASWFATRQAEAEEMAQALGDVVPLEPPTSEPVTVMSDGRTAAELARDYEVCRFFGIKVPGDELPPNFGEIDDPPPASNVIALPSTEPAPPER